MEKMKQKRIGMKKNNSELERKIIETLKNIQIKKE